MRARILLATVLASLGGSVAYLGLAYWDASKSLTRPALIALALPAMLCAIMFATFALIPLWHWLHGARRPVIFIIAGWTVWLLTTAVFLAITSWEPSQELITTVEILVPGLMSVVVFGLVAKDA